MAHASPSETSKTRLGLRVFAVLVAISTMSVFGALWHNNGWIYYIIIGIPGIWSLINVILIALKRPVHPGAHIALDLIFTVAMWFFGVLGLIDETLSYYNGYWEESRWRNMVIAGLSLMVINGFLHFVHFVLGCCDVHWRRHSSVDYNYRKGNFQESA